MMMRDFSFVVLTWFPFLILIVCLEFVGSNAVDSFCHPRCFDNCLPSCTCCHHGNSERRNKIQQKHLESILKRQQLEVGFVCHSYCKKRCLPSCKFECCEQKYLVQPEDGDDLLLEQGFDLTRLLKSLQDTQSEYRRFKNFIQKVHNVTDGSKKSGPDQTASNEKADLENNKIDDKVSDDASERPEKVYGPEKATEQVKNRPEKASVSDEMVKDRPEKASLFDEASNERPEKATDSEEMIKDRPEKASVELTGSGENPQLKKDFEEDAEGNIPGANHFDATTSSDQKAAINKMRANDKGDSGNDLGHVTSNDDNIVSKARQGNDVIVRYKEKGGGNEGAESVQSFGNENIEQLALKTDNNEENKLKYTDNTKDHDDTKSMAAAGITSSAEEELTDDQEQLLILKSHDKQNQMKNADSPGLIPDDIVNQNDRSKNIHSNNKQSTEVSRTANTGGSREKSEEGNDFLSSEITSVESNASNQLPDEDEFRQENRLKELKEEQRLSEELTKEPKTSRVMKTNDQPKFMHGRKSDSTELTPHNKDINLKQKESSASLSSEYARLDRGQENFQANLLSEDLVSFRAGRRPAYSPLLVNKKIAKLELEERKHFYKPAEHEREDKKHKRKVLKKKKIKKKKVDVEEELEKETGEELRKVKLLQTKLKNEKTLQEIENLQSKIEEKIELDKKKERAQLIKQREKPRHIRKSRRKHTGEKPGKIRTGEKPGKIHTGEKPGKIHTGEKSNLKIEIYGPDTRVEDLKEISDVGYEINVDTGNIAPSMFNDFQTTRKTNNKRKKKQRRRRKMKHKRLRHKLTQKWSRHNETVSRNMPNTSPKRPLSTPMNQIAAPYYVMTTPPSTPVSVCGPQCATVCLPSCPQQCCAYPRNISFSDVIIQSTPGSFQIPPNNGAPAFITPAPKGAALLSKNLEGSNRNALLQQGGVLANTNNQLKDLIKLLQDTAMRFVEPAKLPLSTAVTKNGLSATCHIGCKQNCLPSCHFQCC